MSTTAFATKTKAAPAAKARADAGSIRIGEPDDAFEQEADRVADAVMAGGLTRRHWSMAQVAAGPSLQRKCACGGTPGPDGECEECKQNRFLQRKAVGVPTANTVPSVVHEVLNSPGQRLEPTARSLMEARFGYDFSHVRVHTDARAADSATAVNALAYTAGQNIVFGATQYNPTTNRGRQLLAHELAHTIQQRSSGTASDLVLASPSSQLESQADDIVSRAVTGGPTNLIKPADAPAGFILRHSADKSVCPGPPDWEIISAGPKEVYGPANDAIEAAYRNDPRNAKHSVLFGSQFQYGGDPRGGIGLPQGAPDRKTGDALLSRFRGLQRQRAPDIMDFTDRVFYEIKTPNYAASGMVALGSYYAIMDAIRSELGTEGGPPWNPDMATWYPPHVLPFPGRTDRVVCTQMTDYSVTTPGLILYVVLQKVDPDEEKKKKAQRQVVAKPEDKQDSDTQKTKDKQTAQKPKAEDEDDGIGTKVAFGTGGVALTAAAAAYLRKRAIDAAERRALQLAWRKAAEEAAARRAAKVVGEEAAGKVAGKAVVYVEAAAAAALIIFYSDRVEAKPGPGESPIQSLYKAMSASGAPPTPEMKALLENDPRLKELADEAGASGDSTALQQELTMRIMQMVHDNPDAFSDEDLVMLNHLAEAGAGSGTGPKSVQDLRKAIDAAKAGKKAKAGGPAKDDKAAAGSGSSAGGAGKAPGETTPQTTPPPATTEPAAQTPAQRLVAALAKGERGDVKVTESLRQRLLQVAQQAQLPLTDADVDELIKHVGIAEGLTEDQVVDHVKQGIADYQKAKSGAKLDKGACGGAEEKDQGTAPDTKVPESKPDAPMQAGNEIKVSKADSSKNPAPNDKKNAGILEEKLNAIEKDLQPGESRLHRLKAGWTKANWKPNVAYRDIGLYARDTAGVVYMGVVTCTITKMNGSAWTVVVEGGAKLYTHGRLYGTTVINTSTWNPSP